MTKDIEWNGVPRRKNDVYLQSMKIQIDRIDKFITGDPMSSPPIKGCHDRLTKLEEEDQVRDKTKDTIIQTAVGSAAIAIGGALIWIAVAIKAAFMKGH